MKKQEGTGRNKRRRLLVFPIAAGLVLVLAIVIKLAGSGGATQDIDSFMGDSVLVQPLAMQDLSSSVSASGKVESQNVYQVTTDLTYKVKELSVALGDRVEVGDVLCVFDDTELTEQIKNLEAQVSSAELLQAKQREISQRALSEAKSDLNTQVARAGQAVDQAAAQQAQAKQSADHAAAAQQQAQQNYDQAWSDLAAAQTALAEKQALPPETDEEGVEIPVDTAAEEQAVTDAQAALDAAGSALEQATQALDQANSEKLAADQSVTAAQQSLSDTKKSGQSAVQSAQDSIDTAAITDNQDSDAVKELAKLYRMQEELTVKAQQAGIITALNISNGSIPNGVLMQIEDDQNLKVKVSIKEKDIVKIKPEMQATVEANALPGETSSGVITKVINFATSAATDTGDNSGGSYSAEINIAPGSNLLLGMTAKVQITLNEAGNQLAVPYDSIGTDENGTSYVYRAAAQEDGTSLIERVNVTQGATDDYYVAVSGTDTRLQEGDLIVSDPASVTEGQSVTVYNPEEADSFAEGTDAADLSAVG